MVEIRKTEHFTNWLDHLKDVRGRARILARVERLAIGHPGDFKVPGARYKNRLKAGKKPVRKIYGKNNHHQIRCF